MVANNSVQSLEIYLATRLKAFATDLVRFPIDWSLALKQESLRIDASARQMVLELEVGFRCGTVLNSLETEMTEWLCEGVDRALLEALSLDGSSPFRLSVKENVVEASALSSVPKLNNIKHIIAVASGKGGVGKSTVAVNLALALKQEGAKVGLLDADIYGPSIQMMLGLAEDERPEVLSKQEWKPLSVYGIETMSMAYMVTERTPMIWRGPMVSGALLQLLNNTQWPNLDYLVVDMPPGTGDIQLTMVQKVPITGAVIVTTPQDIALLDAKKGVEMFRRVGVPILGVVENMGTHRCSNCGHEEAIFGEEGGERIASLYETHLLGSLPLDITIRQQADRGVPIVQVDPDGFNAQKYLSIARAATASLWNQLNSFDIPIIEVLED